MKYIFTLIAFYCLTAKADLEIKENFVSYPVSAVSKSYLVESLNNSSPIRKNGKVYYGYTAYQIKWKFRWGRSNHMCKLTEVKTSLNLTYTMPKLQSSATDVKTVWASWYKNLETHEKGHGKLAIDTAKLIDNKIKSLGQFKSCRELEEAANSIGNMFMSELKAETKNYDIRTNHGETQGAWLYQHL